MKNASTKRQVFRRSLLLVMFLFFPITIFYFSPYIIIDGASQGIVNGSMVIFILMFLSALLFGRLWCGWLCPAGALGEICFMVQNKPVNGKRMDMIKWVIWLPWVFLIIWMAVNAGGYHAVDFFLDTENGISIAGSGGRLVGAYVIYYAVIGLFVFLSLLAGRRAGCHTICWMAPFMIIGRKIRNLFKWPSLRLQANASTCTGCCTCTANCPMSLDVNAMVLAESMENSECILCGSCVDNCPTKTIRYIFRSGC